MSGFIRWWLRQESNLDLELRKLLYYPLYYEASGERKGIIFLHRIAEKLQ